MQNSEISNLIKQYHGILSYTSYAIICSSDQIKCVKKDNGYAYIYANDGTVWQVKVANF